MNLDLIELYFGKEYLNKWILERYGCFKKFDINNIECTLYCDSKIMERCKEK